MTSWLTASRSVTLLVGGAVVFGMGAWGAVGAGGRILVVGHGPEQPVIQTLAREFERAHPGSIVDLEWDHVLDTTEMVKSGQADLAVDGSDEPGLRSEQVAWDGVAIIVNFTNPLVDVSTQQAQSLFTGKLSRWSELDGADKGVEVIRRTADQNIQTGFEHTLGIKGRMVASKRVARRDQKALASVSGRDNAVSYVSMKSALEAQELGVPIRILTVDQVEPGDPTIKNGRYKIRRPVLFLSKLNAPPLVQSFTEFALSAEGQKILSKMYSPYERSSASPAQAKPSPSRSETPSRG
ncbi:phosphate-binding protein [Nitrospira sp.]|nr:phosphate-binding protein [Nitrospira sp.]